MNPEALDVEGNREDATVTAKQKVSRGHVPSRQRLTQHDGALVGFHRLRYDLHIHPRIQGSK